MVRFIVPGGCADAVLGSTKSMETDGLCGALPLAALLAASDISDEELDATITPVITLLSANPVNVSFALAAVHLLRDVIRAPVETLDSTIASSVAALAADSGAPEVASAAQAVIAALDKPYIEAAGSVVISWH